MYPDYLENWLDFCHSLLIFLILVAFDLVKQIKFAIFGHFIENTREEWPQIWHVDVFWSPSEQISFLSRSVDIHYFGSIVTWWNRYDFGVSGIFFRTHGRNGKIYHANVSWPYLELITFGSWFVGFPHLEPFWLSEAGQMCSFHAFLWQYMEVWAEICHVHLYLVISPEMKKAIFSAWKLSSYGEGVSLTTV